MMASDDGTTPPLEPELGRLLDAERAIPVVPADVRARVMARVRAEMVAQPVVRPARRVRSVGPLRFAAAAGLVLAAAGAFAAFQARTRDVPVRAPGSAPAHLASPASPPAAPEPVTTPAVEAREAMPRSAPAATHARARDYEAELRLLRDAREAAGVRRFDAALASLAEHARRFPAGRLVEEREALRIQALSRLGRGGEARRAAAAFRVRFPRSVLVPRVGDIESASATE